MEWEKELSILTSSFIPIAWKYIIIQGVRCALFSSIVVKQRLAKNVHILAICSHLTAYIALTTTQEASSSSSSSTMEAVETSYTSSTLPQFTHNRTWWRAAQSFPFRLLLGTDQGKDGIANRGLYVSHKYIRWLCNKLVGGQTERGSSSTEMCN